MTGKRAASSKTLEMTEASKKATVERHFQIARLSSRSPTRPASCDGDYASNSRAALTWAPVIVISPSAA
jgi:hypothetical protein